MRNPARQHEYQLEPDETAYVRDLIGARGHAAAAKHLRTSDTTLDRLFVCGVKLDTRERLRARIRELRGEPKPVDEREARIAYALERIEAAIEHLEAVPDDKARFGPAYAAALEVRGELRELARSLLGAA